MTEYIQPLTIGAAGFIVWFLKRLAASVDELNQRMAVYVDRVTRILEHLDDHEARIRRLEDDSRALN